MRIKATLIKPFTEEQKNKFFTKNMTESCILTETESELQILAPDFTETERLQDKVRSIRNTMLQDADKFMLIDYPVNDEDREWYKQYRQYLRDFTTVGNWWELEPLDFETFKEDRSNESVDF